MPTWSKISSYQLLILLEVKNHEQSSRNNQSTWCVPRRLKYKRNIFQKEAYHVWWETNIFWQICRKGTVLHEGTNDQILAKGRVGTLCAHPLPPFHFLLGYWTSKNKESVTCSRESCSFYIKSKLKSEIFTI